MDNYKIHPASIFKLPKENQDYVIRDYYDTLKTFADKEFQWKVWIEASIKNVYTSLLDMRSELLDDCFTYFIYHDASELNFSDELINHLQLLRYKLAKLPYNSTIKEKDILKTDVWKGVVEEAKIVTRLWENDSKAKYYSDSIMSKGYGNW